MMVFKYIIKDIAYISIACIYLCYYDLVYYDM